ncbi:MAG: hypothetical protein Q4C13_05150 [Clostridia bacterium]|nr:hypothetical protein [Clostridia bacterium]
MKEKGKRCIRRAAATAAAGVAAVALGLGAMFDSAGDILHGAEAATAETAAIAAPKPIVAGAKRPAERLRNFLLSRNAAVRGLLLLPLWAAGRALIALLSLLWTAIGPHGSALPGLLCGAALLAGLFALTYKGLFPERSLTSLLKRRRWLWLLGGALLLAAADAALGRLWPDWAAAGLAIRLFCAFVVLTTLAYRIFGPKMIKT